MGVYIQTATGLVKVAGNAEVSAATIVAALGYTPAKNSALTSHKNDTDVHITAEERTTWNNKAEANHNHDDKYAPKTHTHSEYSPTTHNHDSQYAAKDHNHNNVAKTKTYDLSSTADITNSKESCTYGFSYSSSYGGLYPGNRGSHNTFAYAKITFVMPADGTVIMTTYQSSESGYDYGWVSYLDMDLPKDYTTTAVTSAVKYNAKSTSGTATHTYTGVTKGTHYITVRYRKDSSASNGDDTFTIKSLVANYTVSEYAAYDHEHDNYAPKEHTHTEYSTKEELASAVESATQEFVEYVENMTVKEHNHDYNELLNKPGIDSSDDDDSLSIVDSQGNIIAEIDSKGVNSVDFLIKGVSIQSLIGSGDGGLVINVDDISVFDQTIFDSVTATINSGKHVILIEGGVDSYLACKSDGGIHFVNAWGWTDWFDDGTIFNGQYVTSDNINNFISVYMTENYENGDEGSY